MITETGVSAHTREMAKRSYASYTANSGNKNFQGNDCPAWTDLPQAIRDHWCAVAEEHRLFRENNMTTYRLTDDDVAAAEKVSAEIATSAGLGIEGTVLLASAIKQAIVTNMIMRGRQR